MTTVAFHNRHAAEVIQDVRDEINQLRIRETEFREVLIAASEEDRCGVQYIAIVTDGARRCLDEKALVEHFGEEVLEPFYRMVTFQTVRLKRRKLNADARNARVYKKSA
jgi:hypothetical protein